jgi:hypothetical protein
MKIKNKKRKKNKQLSIEKTEKMLKVNKVVRGVPKY